MNDYIFFNVDLMVDSDLVLRFQMMEYFFDVIGWDVDFFCFLILLLEDKEYYVLVK